MKEYYELTLNEIESIGDIETRKIYLKEYTDGIITLNTNTLMRRKLQSLSEIVKYLEHKIKNCDKNYSLIKLEEIYQQLKVDNTSTLSEYFPGHEVLLYFDITKHSRTLPKADQDYLCVFSGATIKKGSLYVPYRPLFEDLNNGKRYVLRKTINTEAYYYGELPTTMFEFEELSRKISSSYENSDETYYNISINLKSDDLRLLLLNQNKKYKSTKC